MTSSTILGLLGTASFIVLDTDYENYGLVCTCQSTKIVFEIFTFHRRSCTILQRRPVRDAEIAKKVQEPINPAGNLGPSGNVSWKDQYWHRLVKCQFSFIGGLHSREAAKA